MALFEKLKNAANKAVNVISDKEKLGDAASKAGLKVMDFIATIRGEETSADRPPEITADTAEYPVGVDFEMVACDEGGYLITGYNGQWLDVSMEIPATINGQPIVGLADRAFEHQLNIQSLKFLKLAEGIRSIGDSAFKNSTICSIQLPQSLQTIGKGAFYGCKVEQLVLPDSVTSVGEECFAHCWKMRTIRLSSNLKELPAGLFDACKELVEVTNYENVTVVGRDAQLRCETIPPRLEIWNENGIIGLAACEEVTLPATLKEICNTAIEQIHCKKLHLPASLGFMSERVLFKGGDFEEIYVEPGAAYGVYGWRTCPYLEKIYIPASVPFDESKESLGHGSYATSSVQFNAYKDGYGRAILNHDGSVMGETSITYGQYQKARAAATGCVLYCVPDSPVHAYAVKKNLKWEAWEC